MAPEILRGNYDFRVDFWSLGILLYELLNGEPPFGYHFVPSSDLDNEITDIEIPQSRYLSETAHHLIKKLLEKDPDQRISSFPEIWGHTYLSEWKKEGIRNNFHHSSSVGNFFIFGGGDEF
jgi:serine/threonine protein kinase